MIKKDKNEVNCIYIENFKCFKGLHAIPIDKINLIYGEPDAGKSAFLDIIEFFSYFFSNNMIVDFRTENRDFGFFKNLIFNHEKSYFGIGIEVFLEDEMIIQKKEKDSKLVFMLRMKENDRYEIEDDFYFECTVIEIEKTKTYEIKSITEHIKCDIKIEKRKSNPEKRVFQIIPKYTILSNFKDETLIKIIINNANNIYNFYKRSNYYQFIPYGFQRIEDGYQIKYLRDIEKIYLYRQIKRNFEKKYSSYLKKYGYDYELKMVNIIDILKKNKNENIDTIVYSLNEDRTIIMLKKDSIKYGFSDVSPIIEKLILSCNAAANEDSESISLIIHPEEITRNKKLLNQIFSEIIQENKSKLKFVETSSIHIAEIIEKESFNILYVEKGENGSTIRKIESIEKLRELGVE